MTDNVTFDLSFGSPPVGTVVSTEEVTTLNGGAVTAQQVQRVALALRTADGTAIDLPGDTANGLDVDITRIASAASPDIGAVADAAVVTDTTGSLSGKLRGLVKWAFERMPASLGQKAMAASLPVVLASDQAAIAVTMAAAPTGGATAANQTTEIARLDTLIIQTDGVEGSLTTIAGAVAGAEMQADIVAALPAGTNNIGDVDVLTLPALPAGTNNIGDVDIASIAAGDNNIGNVDIVTLPALPAGTNNIGDVDVLTLPAITGTVTANAGTGTFATKETRAATSAVTSVSDTASSTTLLAANANRLGATVYNDSTVALYLKLGATASLTSFTVKMAADSYFEVPFSYTGIIDGIWASDTGGGTARISELSA